MILNRENLNLTFLTNLTFVFFPISLILGNFIINANILLFCCLGIFLIKNKISILKFDLSLKIFSLFFLTVILSTCIIFTKSIFLEGYDQSNLVRLIKSEQSLINKNISSTCYSYHNKYYSIDSFYICQILIKWYWVVFDQL